VIERSTKCWSDSRACSSRIDAISIALPSIGEWNWKSKVHSTFSASAATCYTDDMLARFHELWTNRCRESRVVKTVPVVAERR
jgi:hypothetical protein